MAQDHPHIPGPEARVPYLSQTLRALPVLIVCHRNSPKSRNVTRGDGLDTELNRDVLQSKTLH